METDDRNKLFRLTGKFKLLEVLLVIFAAALITGVLSSVASQARARSDRTTCLSNLRQIGQALGQYTEDYQDAWPDESAWAYRISSDRKLKACPAAKPMLDLPRLEARGIPGYAYNLALSLRYHQGAERFGPTRTTDISFPATTVSVCEQPIGIYTANGPDVYKNLPARPHGMEEAQERHGQGAHYLFCDGHVLWYKRGVVQGGDPDGITGNDGTKPTFSVSPALREFEHHKRKN
ncbi:MAG: hypothetical protein H7Z41_12730 [Cytophagales bacterium]|nr:hypothetical protein [Armatimonadota bacterium]